MRIYIPTYSIMMSSTIHKEELAFRRYAIFDRAKERLAISMAIREDDQIFALLETALAQSGQTKTITSGDLKRQAISVLSGYLGSNNLGVGAYLTHPMRYWAGIVGWGSDDLDQASINILVETGQLGVLHGTRVMLSNRVLPTRFYAVTTPDKLGRIPERKSVEISVMDQSWLARYIMTGWENLGFGIHNAAGVAGLSLTDSTIDMPVRYPVS